MKRKKEIEKLAEEFYINNRCLHKTSLEIYKKQILEMYLDTPLTIEEIESKLKRSIFKKPSLKTKEDDYKTVMMLLTFCTFVTMLLTIYMLISNKK